MKDARVVDALIHVDPENDAVMPPPSQLPMRAVSAKPSAPRLARMASRSTA